MNSPLVSEGKHILFQIISSLVPAGAERLVVHLVAHLSRARFAPVCICLESPLGTHYEARVRASGAPTLLSGQRGWGERKRAAPTQRAVSAVPSCGGAYAHYWAELRLPADAALSHARAGAYGA